MVRRRRDNFQLNMTFKGLQYKTEDVGMTRSKKSVEVAKMSKRCNKKAVGGMVSVLAVLEL